MEAGEVIMERTRAHPDFHAVVLLNQEIRKIVGIAGGVYLSAMNAMLIAKRAGDSARGFSVVSRELQRFSNRLQDAMHLLNTRIFRLLMQVAELKKRERMHGHHIRAARAGERARDHLGRLLADQEAEIGQAGAEIGEAVSRLMTEIERAGTLCEMSIALSRAAKIEAVYGGERATALRQVAEGVETTIAEIIITLKGLNERLTGTGT